jgi:hypothetical protein
MQISENSIKFKKISESDYEFLYKLLKERDPKNNISHKKVPTFSQHVKFIKSKPYSKWYIIYADKEKCGTVYLSELNEIAFQLKKEFYHKEIEYYVLKLIMKKSPHSRYLANVNPNNKKKIDFLKKNGFKLIQYTYEFLPEDK